MRKFLAALTVSLALVQGALAAGDSILRPDHPDRYIVKEGDTLWDIGSMFLSDAWLWPEIWHVNPEIENPHLIYPGDTILLTYVDGEPQLSLQRGNPTVKLQPVREGDRNLKVDPRVRSEPLASPIPAIPLDAIAPFMNSGRIVQADELEKAPHILAGTADRLLFGPGDGFYARGDFDADSAVYGIFRGGEVYRDPLSREILGFEAVEVGSATVTKRASDVYTMMLDTVKQDVRIGDRLLPTEERRVESMFFPSAPAEAVDGLIMTVLGGVTQVGRNDVVALNKGLSAGLDAGHVLAVYKAGRIVRDRITGDKVKLPSERAGLLMVFRSFDKMSYGLVLQTESPLRVGDVVRKP